MESVPGHRTVSPRALFRRLRISASAFEQSCPAAFFLLAAVTAVLSVRGNGFPYVLIPAVSALLVWALIPTRDALVRFALPMLPALIAALVWSGQQRNLVADEAGRARFAAEAELTVDDPSASAWPGEAFRVRNLQCRVKRFRYGTNAPWIEFEDSKPRVLLDCGRGENAITIPLGFGDTVLAKGVFSAPEPPLFPGSFDYAAYLEHEGIYELFRPEPESLEVVSHGTGFRRALYDLRDAALAAVCRGFRSVENVRMAGAMLGGRRIALEKETRAGFLSSGTIHILTVSGTHVGIFASLLLLLLVWVPFRKRCLFVLVPLLFYALSTGMREPAMRAYVMIAAFLVLRSLLLATSHINTLMLAAYAILVISPASLLKPGMYYSFLSVALLLSLPRDVGSILLGFLSRKLTQPLPVRYISVWRIRATRWIRILLSAFAATLVASLGSGVLSILYQGLFPVSAVPANLLVMPLAYVAFVAAGVALLFSWAGPVGLFFSGVLEQVFRLIGWLGRFFGGLCETAIPRPPVWTIVLFLAAMFYLLHAKHWRRAACAAALMTVLFLFWCFRAAFFPAEILILSGGGTEQEPAVVVTDPAFGRADVVNVPDYRTGSALADYLHERGITVCRSVAVSSGRKASFDGLDTFAAQIPVIDIHAPSNALSKMPDGPAVTALPYRGAISSCELSDEHFSFSIGTIDGILLSNHTGRGHLTLRKDGILFFDADLTQTSARRLHMQRIGTIPSPNQK
ncbi:MAG: ComEC/Rec2 family competence protein [Lentisphaeria bacterium]|nr:ComEC/Rec2 family competence protein [Lentisphaeria bacterium]